MDFHRPVREEEAEERVRRRKATQVRADTVEVSRVDVTSSQGGDFVGNSKMRGRAPWAPWATYIARRMKYDVIMSRTTAPVCSTACVLSSNDVGSSSLLKIVTSRQPFLSTAVFLSSQNLLHTRSCGGIKSWMASRSAPCRPGSSLN